MSEKFSWKRTFSIKLLLIFAGLSLGSFLLISHNLFLLHSLKGNAGWVNRSGSRRMQTQAIVRLAQRSHTLTGERRERVVAEVRRAMMDMEENLARLEHGDPDLGLPAPCGGGIAAEIIGLQEYWREEFRPTVEQTLASSSLKEAASLFDRLDRIGPEFTERIDRVVATYSQNTDAKVRRVELVQEAFVAFVLASLGMTIWSAPKLVAHERAVAWGIDQGKRLRAILDSTADAIITTDERGVVESFNPSAEAMFGYSACEVTGQNVKILIPAPHRDEHDGYIERYLKTGKARVIGGERDLEGLRKDGTKLPLALRITEASHEEARMFIGIIQDITERKRAEQKIRALAFYDSLTGLSNRRLLQVRLQSTLASARRNGSLVGLLYLDLDRFKRVNDTYGHTVGDRLLCEVAERLVRVVRSSDDVSRTESEGSETSISRLGGDEFIIQLTQIAECQDAAAVAARILDVLAQPIVVDQHELSASASIGIAVFPFDGEDVETLLRNADTAMYHAKGQGSNNWQFYTESMNIEAARRLHLENRLLRALERDEFSIHYQPLRDTVSGRVNGAEALLRWVDPETGPVSPSEFIPIAEEAGLIGSIGEWVLRTACAQWQAWQAAGFQPIRLSVNVSSHQLRQKTLVETVRRILQETGLSPTYLELELTESAVIREDEVTIAALRELDEMGVGLSLDDFGTGYSSLSCLRKFPIRRLKIDGSFVNEITTNPGTAALTAAIIAMAHGLGLTAVAEGVETLEQAESLREYGCDELQGYLFSPAIPPEEFVQFLNEEKSG